MRFLQGAQVMKNKDQESTNTQSEASMDGESSAQTSENNIEANSEVEKLHKECADWKDRAMRTAAEMDNMMRRHERERTETMKFAIESLLHDVIPVLDSFEQAAPGEGSQDGQKDSYLSGLYMVKKQLLTVLKKHGLEPVKSVGEAFDPNVHQAIQRIESETAQAEQVQTEFAKGYVLHGRLVRPAMVSVAVPK
jgi:molecular chaperone GrpE